MSELTPKQIVAELDANIVGQQEAKKAVAIALRNRWRSMQLDETLQEEIIPKNILLIGPTGVGKTEIARRLAKLAKAPFVKVEATKYTEVGYVGRDVEQMVRDLVENAIRLVKDEESKALEAKAVDAANRRICNVIWPKSSVKEAPKDPMALLFGGAEEPVKEEVAEDTEKRQALFAKISNGEMDSREIEVEVEEQRRGQPGLVMMGGSKDDMAHDLQELFQQFAPTKKKKKRLSIEKVKKLFVQEEIQKLMDMDRVVDKAIELSEQRGIIFIDEFDKIAARGQGHGPDVSREGVQRDILPIVEGAAVNTKYGTVKTNHMLFIAAGAFHVAKPSDLIPELQGRFPIRVELQPLSKEDFKRILTEPEHSLIKQYQALLWAEGVNVEFTPDGIEQIASYAYQVNMETENIGARRLHTMVEKILQEIAYEAPDIEEKNIRIDAEFVNVQLGAVVENVDLSHYIL